MSFRDFAFPNRVALAAALYVAAGAAGVTAWMHAAAAGGAAFLCGAEPDAHCWACYVAPMLAAAGLAVACAPERALVQS